MVPVAGSRMTETVLPADMLKLLDPAHITPIVTYLAHESSEHSGSCFEVGGGWYSQVCPLSATTLHDLLLKLFVCLWSCRFGSSALRVSA